MVISEVLANSTYQYFFGALLLIILIFFSNVLSILHRKHPSLTLGMIFTSVVITSVFFNFYQILRDEGLTNHPLVRDVQTFFFDYQPILIILTWTGLVVYNLEMNKIVKFTLLAVNSIFFLVYFELTILHESFQTISYFFEIILDYLKINSTQMVIYWTIGIAVLSIFVPLISFRGSQKYYYLFRIKFLLISAFLILYNIKSEYNINSDLKVPSDASLGNIFQLHLILDSEVSKNEFFIAIGIVICSFIFFTPPQSVYLRYQRIMSSAFDIKTAKLLSHLSKDAYLDKKSYPKENQGLALVGYIENQKTTTVVNVLHKGYDVYIVFQGSTSWKNYVLDVVPFKVKFPHENNPLPFQSRVNKGFHEMYHSIEGDLHTLLSPFVGSKKLHFYITGHSLGGALAILCAMELKEKYDRPTTVYNFGGLRVGNLFFARKYNRLVPDTYRIVNDEDVAPKVQFLSYKHVGHLIFIKPPAKIWVNPSIWFILFELFDDIFGFITGKALSDHRSQKYQDIIEEIASKSK